MAAKIFIKYPHSFELAPKAEVSKQLIGSVIEDECNKLDTDKLWRVYSGEKIVVRVKVGTRTKLFKWRFEVSPRSMLLHNPS